MNRCSKLLVIALGLSMFVPANGTRVRAAVLLGPAPTFRSWSAYLAGTWNCRSGNTPYKVTYRAALGGRWIRGINTSSTSQSEDMMTYDPRTKQWTVFDMEPSGAWSAMQGASDGSDIRMHDPRTRGTVTIHRVSQDEYQLVFRLRQSTPGAPDVCKRST